MKCPMKIKVAVNLIGYTGKSKLLSRARKGFQKYIADVSGKNVRQAKKGIGELYTKAKPGDHFSSYRTNISKGNQGYKKVDVNPMRYNAVRKAVTDRRIALAATAAPVVGGSGYIVHKNNDGKKINIPHILPKSIRGTIKSELKDPRLKHNIIGMLKGHSRERRIAGHKDLLGTKGGI